MRVYYAHCIAIYGTPQEARDLGLLFRLGHEVVNPNDLEVQERVDAAKARGEDVMETIFKPMVLSCEAVAFRALPDGRIPAGVAKEIDYAQQAKAYIPVFELPSGLRARSIGVDETREYLAEVGQR